MKKDKVKILSLAVFNSLKNKNEKEINNIVNNFKDYLQKHSFNNLIPEILKELERLNLADNNVIVVNILSENNLNKEEINNITTILEKKLKKKIKVKSNKENILGGLIIKYQDKIIDMSLKRVLKNLNKQLSN